MYSRGFTSGKEREHILIENQKSSEKLRFASSLFKTPTRPTNFQEKLSSDITYEVKEEYIDGSCYEGQKQRGMKHGRGKFVSCTGEILEGEWKNNDMDGFGTMYYRDGRIAYQGDWKRGRFHGKGAVYNINPVPCTGGINWKDFNEIEEYWIKYEGRFLLDQKHGVGLLTLSNGDCFEGVFNNDVAHGKGKLTELNGTCHTGIWEYNIFVKTLQE